MSTSLLEPKQIPGTHTEFGWWIEAFTLKPACIYYFGPFDSCRDAELAQTDYISDLEQEGAQGITTKIKLCQPHRLTITGVVFA